MRGIRPPALFELRALVAACKGAECRGTGFPSPASRVPNKRRSLRELHCITLPFPGAHCLANRPGALLRLTFQIALPGRSLKRSGERRLVGVGRLALPRLFDLESNRSAFPGEPHAGLPSRSSASEGWSATRDLRPEGSAILSRRGLLFPLKPVAAKWLAKPKLRDDGPERSVFAMLRRGSLALAALRAKAGGHEGTCTPKAARF